MGQQISTSHVQSSHKVNEFDLTFRIDGPIQENANGKVIHAYIKGHLFLNGEKVKSIPDNVKTDFQNFVKSSDFKNYITNDLFVKETQFPSSFPYNVPNSTIEDVSWSLSGDPRLEYENDTDVLLKLDFDIKSKTTKANSLRSVVVLIGRGLISALEEKRREVLPIEDSNGNAYKFGPMNINFSIL